MLPDVQNEGGYNFESKLIYLEELVLAVKAGTITDEFCANNRKSIKPEYLYGCGWNGRNNNPGTYC